MVTIGTTNIISTYAGQSTSSTGSKGDNGAATNAFLKFPRQITLDASNNLYIVDSNNFVVRVVAAGSNIISLVAGTYQTSSSQCAGPSSTTVPASSYCFKAVQGVAVDNVGTVYISDNSEYTVTSARNPPPTMQPTMQPSGKKSPSSFFLPCQTLPHLHHFLSFSLSLSFSTKDNHHNNLPDSLPHSRQCSPQVIKDHLFFLFPFPIKPYSSSSFLLLSLSLSHSFDKGQPTMQPFRLPTAQPTIQPSNQPTGTQPSRHFLSLDNPLPSSSITTAHSFLLHLFNKIKSSYLRAFSFSTILSCFLPFVAP